MTEQEIRTLCASVSEDLGDQFAHNLPIQLRIYADSHGGLADPEDLVRFAVIQTQKYTEQYLSRVLQALLADTEH